MSNTSKLFTTLSEEDGINSNSCVGLNNGGLGNRDYTFGFAHAAELLLLLSLNNLTTSIGIKKDIQYYNSNEYFIYADPLIYPIVFNARHYIELAIKNGIEKFLELVLNIESLEQDSKEKNNFKRHPITSPCFKSENIYKEINSHNLISLFGYLRKMCNALDRRVLDKYFKDVEDFIEDIHSYDSDGTSFRYRTDNMYKNDNLDGLNVINRRDFLEGFKLLRDSLDSLNISIGLEINNFLTLTWTPNLSRNDISDIANKLPNISSWKEINFKSYLENVKEEYNLSNKELSKAIDIIKSHRKFVNYIGGENSIYGLNSPLVDKVKKYTLTRSTNSEHLFTQEELRLLFVVTIFSQDYDHPERFEEILEYRDDCLDVRYVLNKALANVPNYTFPIKLRALGQLELANYWDELKIT